MGELGPCHWPLALMVCCRCCQVTSAASDPVRPHRQQPTRLPCPWDSPSKNTGVGHHFLLQCVKVKSESGVAQSCPTGSDPMDCSPPGSSVHGIFQARVLEWAAIAFSPHALGVRISRYHCFSLASVSGWETEVLLQATAGQGLLRSILCSFTMLPQCMTLPNKHTFLPVFNIVTFHDFCQYFFVWKSTGKYF